MRAGLERWLLAPIADVTPSLFKHSRRGARLAERLAGDRPLLTLSSALAEVSGQTAGLGKPGAGIPRVLVDKLAYALHRAIDEQGRQPTPWDFTFPAGTAPEPIAPELRPLQSAVEELLSRLERHGLAAESLPQLFRRRTRISIDEGPPAGFFYTEDPGPVPPGMLLALDDVDSKPLHFVGVRGPMLSGTSQWYAADRALDIIKEPIFDEGPRLRRLAGGRFGALLAALDELVVVDEDHPRLAWVINPSSWQALPVVRGKAPPLELKTGPRTTVNAIEQAVRALPFASDQDRSFVTALVTRNRFDGIAAQLLLDHPFVEHPDGRTLRVVQGRVRVDVDDDGRVSLSALSHPVFHDELAGDGASLVFDGPGHRVVVVVADQQERALARALGRVGDQPLPAAVLAQVGQRLKRARVDVALPERLRGQRVTAPRTVLVRVAFTARTFSDGRVDPIGGGARFSIVSRPFVGGTTHLPGEGTRVVFASDGVGGSQWCERDLDHERKLAEALFALVGIDDDDDDARNGAFSFARRRPDTALAALAALYAHNDVIVAVADDGPRVQRASAAQLKVRLHDGTDWLGVEGGVQLPDGQRLELQALIDALREGRRYVVLERGDIVTVDDDVITALGGLTMFSRGTKAGGIEVPSLAASVVADELGVLGSDQVEGRWRLVTERIEAARSLDGSAAATVTATLRPYQQDGLRFLRRLAALGSGGVLADDMGLGKTLTTTCLLVDRQSQGPQLVVAPTSLGFHWAEELRRFAPTLNPIVLGDIDGADARVAAVRAAGAGDVVITSYGLITRDIGKLEDTRFATLIVDEAQAAKNATTARAKALRRITADFKLALTGTPLENHTGELWAIIDLVAPGLFGSFAHFKSRFADPIEKDHDDDRRRRLARALRPFILRRKKVDVATDLPAKTERTLVLTPTPEERQAYERLRQAILVDLENRGILDLQTGKKPKKRDADDTQPIGNEHRVQILAALTRLRLCACHPALVDDVADLAAVPPATKHETLVNEMLELREQGHHALVFSQFVKHLKLAERFLKAAGLRTLILTGDTPGKERQRLVERFQAGEADVFLISLKAGGFGLNLTRASYVAHLDPWWNPAVENQASDRAHRIGQTLPVTVTRLVIDDTIEAPILKLHERKRALADGLLEGTDIAGQLSLDELTSLIRSSRRHVDDDAVELVLR